MKMPQSQFPLGISPLRVSGGDVGKEKKRLPAAKSEGEPKKGKLPVRLGLFFLLLQNCRANVK